MRQNWAKQNVVRQFRPVGGSHRRRVFTARLHLLDLIEDQVNCSVLARRAGLMENGMNGHTRTQARKIVPMLVGGQRLHDRERTVLASIGLSAPPNQAKDLTGAKVVDVSAALLFMIMGRIPEAQVIEL